MLKIPKFKFSPFELTFFMLWVDIFGNFGQMCGYQFLNGCISLTGGLNLLILVLL